MTSNLDIAIQFSLLCAGEEEDWIDRKLGPIHLIKYVYLIDLTHAKLNSGITFTESDWSFYKFGPWSLDVYNALEPALSRVNAQMDSIESSFSDDDFVRWSLKNSALLKSVEKKIQLSVMLKIKNIIRKFKNETALLLDYVYKTEPMLKASPHQRLGFNNLEQMDVGFVKGSSTEKIDSLSNNKRRKLVDRLEQLSSKYQNQKIKKYNPVYKNMYDNVYKEGVQWLDNISGEEVPEGKFTAKFNKNVWKSETRKSEN